VSGDVDRRTAISVGLALVALIAIVAAAIALASGGGEAEEPATGPAPAEAPAEGVAPPGSGGLPPGIEECLAEQGVELSSPADLHAAPPETLQACFEALHQGGGSSP
jgi:hypothetical protein